ncbi:MAG TPA: nicotinate-nucleotide adenylyltransferase [Chromatiales bacterium]|nr:nicotinate-nucleotide adenylyltransferase [Chromatiales bacterium]
MSTAPVGIYGGSFDPVHIGHLRSALELRDELGLAEVRFVPSRVPPHRETPQAPAAMRVKMLQVAVDGLSGFVVDQRELEREGPSFTIDTLESLRSERPGQPVVLLLGMDAFAGLTSWHRWQDVLDCAHIAVARRPGASLPETGELGRLVEARRTSDPARLHRGQGRIIEVEVTALDVSSSAIRELVARGRDPKFLVPDPVRELVFESHCYSSAAESADPAHGGG